MVKSAWYGTGKILVLKKVTIAVAVIVSYFY